MDNIGLPSYLHHVSLLRALPEEDREEIEEVVDTPVVPSEENFFHDDTIKCLEISSILFKGAATHIWKGVKSFNNIEVLFNRVALQAAFLSFFEECWTAIKCTALAIHAAVLPLFRFLLLGAVPGGYASYLQQIAARQQNVMIRQNEQLSAERENNRNLQQIIETQETEFKAALEKKSLELKQKEALLKEKEKSLQQLELNLNKSENENSSLIKTKSALETERDKVKIDLNKANEELRSKENEKLKKENEEIRQQLRLLQAAQNLPPSTAVVQEEPQPPQIIKLSAKAGEQTEASPIHIEKREEISPRAEYQAGTSTSEWPMSSSKEESATPPATPSIKRSEASVEEGNAAKNSIKEGNKARFSSEVELFLTKAKLCLELANNSPESSELQNSMKEISLLFKNIISLAEEINASSTSSNERYEKIHVIDHILKIEKDYKIQEKFESFSSTAQIMDKNTLDTGGELLDYLTALFEMEVIPQQDSAISWQAPVISYTDLRKNYEVNRTFLKNLNKDDLPFLELKKGVLSISLEKRTSEEALQMVKYILSEEMENFTYKLQDAIHLKKERSAASMSDSFAFLGNDSVALQDAHNTLSNLATAVKAIIRPPSSTEEKAEAPEQKVWNEQIYSSLHSAAKKVIENKEEVTKILQAWDTAPQSMEPINQLFPAAQPSADIGNHIVMLLTGQADASEGGSLFFNKNDVSNTLKSMYGESAVKTLFSRYSQVEHTMISSEELKFLLIGVQACLTSEQVEVAFAAWKEKDSLLSTAYAGLDSGVAELKAKEFDALSEEELANFLEMLRTPTAKEKSWPKNNFEDPFYFQLNKDIAFLQACRKESMYNPATLRENSRIAHLVKDFGPQEFLARDIAYGLFYSPGIGAAQSTSFTPGVLFSMYDSNGKRVCRQILPHIDNGAGLLAVNIIPARKCANPAIQTLFRGSADNPAWMRDFRPSEGIGEASFNAGSAEMKKNLLAAIEEMQKVQGRDTPLTFEAIGHSLGSSDAQRMMVLFVEMISTQGQPGGLPNDVKVKELLLNTWNAPGAGLRFIRNWEKLGGTEAPWDKFSRLCLELYKKEKMPEITLNYFKVEKDIVQSCGGPYVGFFSPTYNQALEDLGVQDIAKFLKKLKIHHLLFTREEIQSLGERYQGGDPRPHTGHVLSADEKNNELKKWHSNDLELLDLISAEKKEWNLQHQWNLLQQALSRIHSPEQQIKFIPRIAPQPDV